MKKTKLSVAALVASSFAMAACSGPQGAPPPPVSATSNPTPSVTSKLPPLKTMKIEKTSPNTPGSSPATTSSSPTAAGESLSRGGALKTVLPKATASPSLETLKKFPATKEASPGPKNSPSASQTTPLRQRQASVAKPSSAHAKSAQARAKTSGKTGAKKVNTTRRLPAKKIAPASYKNLPNRVYATSISIKKIGMNRTLHRIGLTSRGMINPAPGYINWYKGSAVPGSPGNSVLLGHATWNFRANVFYRLPELTYGDKITIGYSNGTSRTFTVYAKDSVNKRSLTKDQRIWGKSAGNVPVIALVTCDTDSRLKGYNRVNNLVVWAK